MVDTTQNPETLESPIPDPFAAPSDPFDTPVQPNFPFPGVEGEGAVADGAPPILDLDDLESPEVPVVLKGKTYYMAGKHDLSMADREEMRLILLQIHDMTDRANATTKKTGLTAAEKRVYKDLEIRICRLALPMLPEEELETLTAAQRNALVDRFFKEADVMEMLRSFVTTLQQRATRKAASAPFQTGSAPLPPQDLLGLKRLANTTGNAS